MDFGSSDEGKDSEEDAGKDTYVDEFSNDDDDSEGDVGKRETAPFRILSYAT